MEAYQVILLVIVLLAFFYIVLVAYVLGKVHEFKLHLRRRMHGLNLLLSQRAKAILAIVDEFQKSSLNLSEEQRACFDRVAHLDFSKPTETMIKESVALIKEATSRLKAIAEENPKAQESETFQYNLGLLNDLERNYRTVVGLYNADVVAFNYWISIPTVSWISRYILRHRKRALLN